MTNWNFGLAMAMTSIILNAAEKLSGTHCEALTIIPTNDGTAFWLPIVVGMSPYNVNQLVWDRRVADKTERHYAHLYRIRIPLSLSDLDNRDDEKLRQIGRALADIWGESHYLPIPRTDRKYILPHIDQFMHGTEAIPIDATQKLNDPDLRGQP